MKPQLSRREFFKALVPGWVTKKNLIAGAVAAGVAIAVALVVSVVREVGFINLLKVLAFSLGLLCLMFALNWIGIRLRDTFRILPPFVQAVIVVTLRFLGGVALGAVGVYAYTRWRATGDIITPMIVLIPLFISAVSSEWQKRRTNRTIQSTTVSPPSPT